MRSSDNLLKMLRRASPSSLLPKVEASSARSCESPDTSCSSVAVWSCHTGGPSLLRTGAAGGGLGGTKGAKSPSSVAGSHLSSAGFFLMLAAQDVRHLHHQRQPYDLAAQRIHHLRVHACLVYELDMLGFRSDMANYISPWVTRSLTRLGRWLVRKTRQVLHNMSHCGVLSWRGVQAKSWTCNFVSCRVHFQSHTQFSHLRRGKQDGHVNGLKHINLGGTWCCCWKEDNATVHAGFCLGGEHERLITTANFCRNTVVP